MTGNGKRDVVVAVRLTASEKQKLEARAALHGGPLSDYLRDVLLGHAARPLPNLAAAAELLAICQTLVDAAEVRADLSPQLKEFAQERAERVFEILRQHGHKGTIP
ncbi:MAG: hypothetical protein F9K30_21540 [Dechloromonas sp.]|jgi:hypothetical protein|nr:MAG: hypothetical protein F9K30_21540 [Dechloromonas sp.]